MPYSYITFAQAKSALAQRLQDTGKVFTTDAELGTYITEGLRVLNALTAIWNVDYFFNFVADDTWKLLSGIGYPRQRTVTDSQVFTQMQYMMLEPPSGSTWTGTSQYNITNFAQSLQYRRDELLKAVGANTQRLTMPSPTASPRTTLPDNALDLRRVRWISVDSTAGDPWVLGREDRISVNAYGDTLSLIPGYPDSWLIASNTPLNFDVSCTPAVPGRWDTLIEFAGDPLTPPTSSILNLPNDWCWVSMYGALADLLVNSPEATDHLRAEYCMTRYKRGMKAMGKMPWMISASVASLPVGTPPVVLMDAYAQDWEAKWPPDDPNIVIGGIDLISLAPWITTGGTLVSAVLTVVENAPIPVLDTDFIQLEKSGVDQILNYSQHIAMFKRGGSDFSTTYPLYEQFEAYCASVNANYSALGIFREPMVLTGSKGKDVDPVFAGENQ